MKLMIRAHECVENGYKYFFQDKGITVFSATNYMGSEGNSGALLLINKDSNLTIEPKIIQPKRKKDSKWDEDANNKYPDSPLLSKYPPLKKN